MFITIKIVIPTRSSEFRILLGFLPPAPPGSSRRPSPAINQGPQVQPVINMPQWAGLGRPRPPCPWGFLHPRPLQRGRGGRRELGGPPQPPDLSPSV